MLEQASIKLPQGDIAFLKNQHKRDKPWLLALHGWLDNAASFQPLMAVMDAYNWVAIDLPGHGHSFHRPSHSHYHFIDWLTDLVAFHSAMFGEQKVYLLGHSLGGMLSTVLASLYPELVHKLALIDAAGLVTQDEVDQAKSMRKALDSRLKQQEKSKTVHKSLDSAIQARFAAGDLSLEAVALLVARNITQTSDGFEWQTDQRLRTGSPIRINQETARDIIRQLDKETLIVLAEQGHSMVKRNLSRFENDYKKLTMVEVSGGHHSHMDHPQDVARHLAEFFR